MHRGIAVFLAASTLLALSGCGPGDGSETTTPTPTPTPTPLPEYVECTSTVPVDSSNPNEPVITLIGPRVVSQPLGAAYVDAGATAADPHDGNISSQIVVTGLNTLNTNAAGDYLI